MGCSHGRAVGVVKGTDVVVSTYAGHPPYEPEIMQSLSLMGQRDRPWPAWCPDCGAIRLPLLQKFPRNRELGRYVSQGVWWLPSDPRFGKEFVKATELGVPAEALRPSELSRQNIRYQRDEWRGDRAAWEGVLGRADRMGKKALRARTAMSKRNPYQVCGWVLTTVCGLTQREAAEEAEVGSAGSVGRWTRRLRRLAVAEAGLEAYDAYVAAAKRDATVLKAVRTYVDRIALRCGEARLIAAEQEEA